MESLRHAGRGHVPILRLNAPRVSSARVRDLGAVLNTTATCSVASEINLDGMARSIYDEGITEKGGGPVEMNSGSKHDEILREVIDC